MGHTGREGEEREGIRGRCPHGGGAASPAPDEGWRPSKVLLNVVVRAVFDSSEILIPVICLI